MDFIERKAENIRNRALEQLSYQTNNNIPYPTNIQQISNKIVTIDGQPVEHNVIVQVKQLYGEYHTLHNVKSAHRKYIGGVSDI